MTTADPLAATLASFRQSPAWSRVEIIETLEGVRVIACVDAKDGQVFHWTARQGFQLPQP